MMDGTRDMHSVIDDCWNRTGVWGAKDCPELARVLNCNNCEVYSCAGRALLDRAPPEGYDQEWTDLLAEDKTRHVPGADSAFVFRVGHEYFALPTRMLVEVLEPRPVHKVPHRGGSVFMGLVNVRGELQLCVSIAAILEVDATGADEDGDGNAGLMLFIEKGDEHIVFPADEVFGIIRYRKEELGEVPATLSKASSNYVRGLLAWDKGHVSMLDEGLLFKRIGRSLL